MTVFEDCMKKSLLKRNEHAKNWAAKELQISERFLNSSRKNIAIEEFEITVIAAYDSLFHSCRALLFRQGIVEKSHYCMIAALKEIFNQDEELLEFLKGIDQVRVSRHRLQYSGDSAGKQEADFVLNLAKSFLEFTRVKANA